MHCLVGLFLLSTAVTVFSDDCTCKPDQTCCPGISGEYSCCPLENAVCCETNTHCCPQGTECDIEDGLCLSIEGENSKQQSLAQLENRMGEIEEESLHNDCKQSTCTSDETCCPGIPGGHSCCPFPNAVCCAGNTFCCPEGTECFLPEGKCLPKETTDGDELEKRQGTLVEESNFKQQCGDGSLCPFDSTCCFVTENKYGCCPHLHATCCPDGIHCCPHDQLCDVTSHYCIGKLGVQGSSVKEPAFPIDFEDSA